MIRTDDRQRRLLIFTRTTDVAIVGYALLAFGNLLLSLPFLVSWLYAVLMEPGDRGGAVGLIMLGFPLMVIPSLLVFFAGHRMLTMHIHAAAIVRRNLLIALPCGLAFISGIVRLANGLHEEEFWRIARPEYVQPEYISQYFVLGLFLALFVSLLGISQYILSRSEIRSMLNQKEQDMIQRDPHRPRYHFMPPAEWMNDPNGPIWWRGEYHLFYQYGPLPDNWGLKYWGHAVSGDLAHWRELPIALEPTPGGPDKDGVWSGCAVDDDGALTLIYTGVEPEVQCIAASRDGVTFEKYAGNPVIAGPPEGLAVTGFRDPCVWRENDGWYMLIGSGIKDVGGAPLLYRSSDLRQWEYLHPLCVGNKEETGEMWECPDFFALGDRHLLFFSPFGLPTYFVGDYSDHRFAPSLDGKLDYGWHFYAPKSFLDGQGRRILWGWCWEGRTDAAQHAAGWAGVMSLPRVLTLGADGLLCQAPAPEVEALRGGEHMHIYDRPLTGLMEVELGAIPGDSLELRVVIDPGNARAVGISFLRSLDGQEETRLVFTRETGMLGIDRAKSSLDPAQNTGYHDGPVILAADEQLELRIFIDRSLLEVFANGRTCLTSRIYPSRGDSRGISPFAEGGEAGLLSLEAWDMQGIWD